MYRAGSYRGNALSLVGWVRWGFSVRISVGTQAILTEIFCGSSQIPQLWRNSVSIRPWPTSYKSYPIHQSSVIYPFDATWYMKWQSCKRTTKQWLRRRQENAQRNWKESRISFRTVGFWAGISTRYSKICNRTPILTTFRNLASVCRYWLF
jgi:hypothetical protein